MHLFENLWQGLKNFEQNCHQKSCAAKGKLKKLQSA